MNKKTIISIIVGIGIIVFLIYLNKTAFDISPEIIKEWILSLGVFAPLIYILLYSFRPFILFPASILSLAGGLAFGPVYGTILTIIGATIGAYLSFMFARKLGAKKIEEKFGNKTVKLKKTLEKNGFVVVLLLRLIPIFSFDLISYSAGLSNIKTSQFVLATILGIIPGTFAYNFLGASTVSDNKSTFIIAVIIFAIVLIIPALFKNKIKKFLSISDDEE